MKKIKNENDEKKSLHGIRRNGKTPVRYIWLQYSGHLVRASPREDHHRVVAAALQKPPPEWKDVPVTL